MNRMKILSLKRVKIKLQFQKKLKEMI